MGWPRAPLPPSHTAMWPEITQRIKKKIAKKNSKRKHPPSTSITGVLLINSSALLRWRPNRYCPEHLLLKSRKWISTPLTGDGMSLKQRVVWQRNLALLANTRTTALVNIAVGFHNDAACWGHELSFSLPNLDLAALTTSQRNAFLGQTNKLVALVEAARRESSTTVFAETRW